MIPVAIVGAKQFYVTFTDILNVIGYWCAAFAAIVLADHFIIRKNDWGRYDLSEWADPKRLPVGGAAVLTFLCACGLVVPCMSQVWYTGPIAALGTGDIGIPVGFALAFVLYLALRVMERRMWGR